MQLPTTSTESLGNMLGMREQDQFQDMTGQPLNDGLLRVIQSFNPASIQTAGTDDQWSGQSGSTAVTITLNPNRQSVQSIARMAAFPTVALPPEKIKGQLENSFETGAASQIALHSHD